MKKEWILAGAVTWGLLLALLTGFASLPVRASDADRPDASLDDDHYADLATGVAYEDVGSIIDAGAVNVLYGSDSAGLTAEDDQYRHQDIASVINAAESGDRFGLSLASLVQPRHRIYLPLVVVGN